MADGNSTSRPRRARKTPAHTTPDPIEMAMEAEAAGRAPVGEASLLLAAQRRLIGWEIADRRAAFGLKLLMALAAVAVAGLIAWACWDASRASGIVVRPFETSPGLTAQGFSAESTANEVVSRVAALQAATNSSREERRSAISTDGVALVIPQTGVSVGEAQRLLREALGRETIVSGALRPAPGGELRLSLRVDGRLVPVSPPPPDQTAIAEAWLDRAAEAVMRETDPYRFHVWLAQEANRQEEATALVRRLTQRGPAKDRAWAWSGLSQQLRREGRVGETIAALNEAVRLDPTNVTAWGNLMTVQLSLGHEQAAYGFARRAGELAGERRGRLPVGAMRARLENDWVRLEALAESSIANGVNAAAARAGHMNRALSLAKRHDVAGARSAAASGAFNLLTGPNTVLWGIAEREALADWAGLERLMLTPWAAPGQERINAHYDPVLRTPWRAYAVAQQGRISESLALIGTTPPDCYLCVRMRGRIAALAGRSAEADRWFAEAARQAPALADAEYEWGSAKLGRGDAAGALPLFRAAARKAPGWAEPPKGEADALVRLGQTAPALKRYAAAAERAPRWGGLHLAWGEALAARGATAEASAKWLAATTMDLTSSERVRLHALLQKRTT